MSARLVHADLEDTSVSEGGSTIATIKRVIEEIRPTTVYTHTLRDVHQDHRNAHNATLVAARGVPRVFCYQAPSSTVDFHPTRFVGDRRVPRPQDRGHPGLRVAGRGPRLPRRGAAALDRALLGPLRPGALRRAARDRPRQRRTHRPARRALRDRPPRGSRRRCRLTTPRVLVTGVGGPSGISILRAMEGEPVTMLAAPTSTRTPQGSTSSRRSAGRSCRAGTIPASRRCCSTRARGSARRSWSRPSTPSCSRSRASGSATRPRASSSSSRASRRSRSASTSGGWRSAAPGASACRRRASPTPPSTPPRSGCR